MKEENVLMQLKETVKYLKNKIHSNPKIAIVLGSGLGSIQNKINNPISISYNKIPHFKKSTVEGHLGELVVGKVNSKDIIFLNGRLHYYEGYSMKEISYPIRVLKALGVEKIIITCAVGSINKKYNPGDIVVIKDHINFMGDNPLIGKYYNEFGDRFPDMSEVYDETFRKKILNISKKNKIKIHEGVYFAVSGPSYETPAEVNAYRKLGADVVGMSLVPEAIVANQSGMKIMAITYVSNKASGLSKGKLEHCDVLKAGKISCLNISKIIVDFIRTI